MYCSPDGLCYNAAGELEGIIDIKCPLVLEKLCPADIDDRITETKPRK